MIILIKHVLPFVFPIFALIVNIQNPSIDIFVKDAG
jgi:hypothetical protein